MISCVSLFLPCPGNCFQDAQLFECEDAAQRSANIIALHQRVSRGAYDNLARVKCEWYGEVAGSKRGKAL